MAAINQVPAKVCNHFAVNWSFIINILFLLENQRENIKQRFN